VGLLSEKRRELGDKANKLKGGLEKLSETSEQVGVAINLQWVCMTMPMPGLCQPDDMRCQRESGSAIGLAFATHAPNAR
jgi:hypothetical protein